MADETVHQNGVGSSDEETEGIPPQQPATEERTLTDHLNKRLLESFLNRLDQGTFEVPNDQTTTTRQEDEDPDSFEET